MQVSPASFAVSDSMTQMSPCCPANYMWTLLLLLLLLHAVHDLFSRKTWISRYQKGKTSPDINDVRDYGVLGWQWHWLDHMQTICTSLQTDNHTNRLDALPGAQPTVSKHWRHVHMWTTSPNHHQLSCAKQRANCNTTAVCLIAKANFTEITPKAIELALKFLVQLHYTTSMILKNCVAWWCNS